MIKIDDHTDVDLDNLAETHYNNLIGEPLLGLPIRYHSRNSLIGRITRQRNSDLAARNTIRVLFWNYLLDNNFVNLKRVIISRPSDLANIISEIQAICGTSFFSNELNYNKASLNPFGEIVKNVFNYTIYRGKVECRDNCNQFKLSYCPYCNEQPIQVITEINGLTGDEETTALLQLDHFYPQCRHPYFSVSFFNLIPGCSVCNAQLKIEKKFSTATHFNPFEKRLDDYFEFQLDTVILSSIDDVLISYRNKQAYPKNALLDFKITERYKNYAHKRVVYNLVMTFKNHSPKINNSIGRQIINLFTAGESKRGQLLFNCNVPLNKNEINQVQLGKLKRDIAIQLRVLNP